MKFDLNLDCHIWIDDIALHLSDDKLTEKKIRELRASPKKAATPVEICNNIKLSLVHIQKKLGIAVFDTDDFESLRNIQTKINCFQEDIALLNQLPAEAAIQQLNIILLNFGAIMYEVGIHNTAAQTNQAMTYGVKSKRDSKSGADAVIAKNNQYREKTISIAKDFYQKPEHQAVKYSYVTKAIKQLIRENKKSSIPECVIKRQIFDYVPVKAKAGGRPCKEHMSELIVQEYIKNQYANLLT
ncbi:MULTISPECIES: hypothetical protein [unclassified Shewanella]|uniref:hypothetical protein n=1 Tax=unclassified Shewanella TaxID=196818 RepID=UPI00354DAB33